MDAETAANAAAFRQSLVGVLTANHALAEAQANKLDAAYGRLTTLQAWRDYVVEQNVSAGPLAFFTEAQNDGLISSVLVASGLWRSALKSLRSLTENIAHCVYYMDHPVEYELWENEKHRMPFKSLFDYLEAHPRIRSLSDELNPVGDMRNQYGRLSNAVHSSVKPLRMTSDEGAISLGRVNAEILGKWQKEQSICLRNCNLLLTAIFCNKLKGTAARGLRERIGLALTKKISVKLKSETGVIILH